MDIKQAIMTIAQNNPGAVNVCMELMHQVDAPDLLLGLLEDRIIGPGLWLAYKDICGQDIDTLAHRLREDRKQLVVEVEKIWPLPKEKKP